MSKSIIKTIKSLTLKRLNPVVILRRYLAGEFKDIKIPDKKIKITSFVNLNKKIGTDRTSEIYKFRNKTNTGQLIVTTNQKSFENTNKINHCIWCRRLINTKPIGIPVSMEYNKKSKETLFYIEDTYCNFSCALAGLKRLRSCHRIYKDPLYMDADQMLHLMYHTAYPSQKCKRIIEAKDWRLLDINGGPLSNSEYENDNMEYSQITNLVLSPIKRQYIKLSINK